MKRKDPNADVTDLKRRLKAERLEEQIRQAVEADPHMTAAQLDRLAALFGGSDAA